MKKQNKYFFHLIAFLMLSNCAFGQNEINIIEYKNRCDSAYSCFLQKNYKQCITVFEEINKLHPLRAEEMSLLATCYGIEGDIAHYKKARRESINTYFIDFSFRLSHIINYQEADKLVAKSNPKLAKFDKKLYGKKRSETFDFSDSLLAMLKVMVDDDQAVRKELTDPENESRYDAIILKMAKVDSINQEKLLYIVHHYGFPGDRLVPYNQVYGELILFHMFNGADFEEKNKLYFNEVLKENLNPEAYAYWYDRNMNATGKQPLYKIFSEDDKRTPSEIIENRKKIGMSKYYSIYFL